jgi:hypothetical protein
MNNINEMEIDLSGSEEEHHPVKPLDKPQNATAINGKNDSFDDMSDGVNSDHEAKPSIGISQLNGQKNQQANKNVFA